MDDYLTTAVAAELLDLSPRRVRQLAARIGGIEVAGRLVFPRAKVLAFKRAPRPKPGYPKGRPRKPADTSRAAG